MKHLMVLILLFSLIGCTSLKITNFSYTKEGTQLSFEELEYYNAEAEAVAKLLEALK